MSILSTRSALFLLAIVSAGCGASSPQSKTTMRTLPEADPKAAKKYLKASELMHSENAQSVARAEGLFKEALALDSYLWEAHYNLGVLYRRRGELRSALRQLAAAHETQPGAGEPLLALAEVHHALGEPEQASELLEDYIEGHPHALPARVAWAALLRRQERLDAALTQARFVLLADPKNSGALLEVGRVYRQRGEYDGADLVFQRVLLLDEKSPAPHNELGLTALARGDTQLAFAHFARAIDADKGFAAARINQAVVLLQAGDYQAAAEEYRRVLGPHDRHDEARVGLAVALRALGKHPEAEAEYERVLSHTPNHGAALFDLAVLRADFLDRRVEARPLFERYLSVAGEGAARAAAERYLATIPKAPAPSATKARKAKAPR